MRNTHTLQRGALLGQGAREVEEEEGEVEEEEAGERQERATCARRTGTVWRCKTNNNNKVESCGGLRERRRALICAPSKVKISLRLRSPISRAPSRFPTRAFLEIDLADFFSRYVTLRCTDSRAARRGLWKIDWNRLNERKRGGDLFID